MLSDPPSPRGVMRRADDATARLGNAEGTDIGADIQREFHMRGDMQNLQERDGNREMTRSRPPRASHANPARRRATSAGLLLVLSATGTLASAVEPSSAPVLLNGDPVIGVGDITAIDAVVVNDSGEWIVVCDTNHPDPSVDRVVIRGGAMYLREGDVIDEPIGSSIAAFRSIDLNTEGESVWYLKLDGTPLDQDTGIFAETDLLIQEGDTALSSELPTGSTHSGFFGVQSNTSGVALINGTLDVPGEWSNVPALTLLTYEGATGPIPESTVIRAGDVPAGEEFFVDTIANGPHSTALNTPGHAAYVVELIDLTSIFMIDDTVLVREAAPSPVDGVSWGDFDGIARVDLNDQGSWALRARLATSATSDDVIVIDGAIVERENDALAAFGGAAIDGFGTGPIVLADDGTLLWYVDTDADDASDTALMLDDEILVREGVSQIDGATVTLIRDSERAYDMSPNGRYITAHLTLSDGRQRHLPLRPRRRHAMSRRHRRQRCDGLQRSAAGTRRLGRLPRMPE